VLAGLWGTLAPALAEGGLAAFLAWPGAAASLRLSVVTGVASTALALALTLLIIAALHGTRAFAALQHLLSPLLAVPHAAVALGLAFLIAPSGWIARMLSPWATGWERPPDLATVNDPMGIALILGLVAKEVPFLLLMALAALPQTDAARRLRVTSSLGAGRIAGFAVAVLPALYRQIRLPVYAVLAYAMTAVEMGLVLGPSLPPPLSVQIALWMAEPGLAQRPLAAGAAMVQLGAVLAALAAWRGAELLGRALLRGLTFRGLRLAGADGAARALALGAGGGLAGAVALALAGLAVWSVAGLWTFPAALPESVSLATWTRAAPELGQSAGLTLAIALGAMLPALALVVACLQAEHRFGLAPRAGAMGLLYLPLLVPQVAFLPGLQVLALRLGIDGHWTAVAAVHLVFVLPYVFLSLSAPWRAWDARHALAGATLGATPARVFWRLRLPMLLQPLLTAAAVGLAVSVGQYLPTLLIGGGRVETLTTEAVALSSGGNRRLIGAFAMLQTVLPMLAFALALALPALAFRNRRAMRAAA
jgi:putative thiamine transport system permease protein